MPAPFLRGQSAYITATGASLTIPLPARNIDDFVFVTFYGNDWMNGITGSPGLPPGYIFINGDFTSAYFRVQAYKRITQPNEPDFKMSWAPTTYWAGQIDVYGGVDYRDPGFLDIAGGSGNYATASRAAIPTPSSTFQVLARFSVDALGVNNRIESWTSNDMGFGLNSSNRPYLFINNTLGNPIGNVAANADIPLFAAGKKVWIWANLNIATGVIDYKYSYMDIEYAEFPFFLPIGTAVAGTNGGTTPRVTNSTTIYFGTIAGGTPTGMNIYTLSEWGNTAHNFHFSKDVPTVTTLGTTVHRRPSTGNSSPIEGIKSRFITIPAVSASQQVTIYGGDNRLAFTKWQLNSSPAPVPPPNPAFGPATGWEKLPERQAAFTTTFGLKEALYTEVVDQGSTTIAVDIVDGGGYSAKPGATLQLTLYVLRPLPEQLLPPASPQPPNVKLGCATEYTTWFTDGSYESRIDSARWSAITWERTLDAISTASATFPDEYGGVRCLARLGGLEPWRFGLLIERDGVEVWRGPVITVKRVKDGIQVSAADTFARYQKRFAIRDEVVSYTNIDAGYLFQQVINTHAASTLDQWSLPVPKLDVNVNLTRQLKPREFKYAWDLLSELLASSIDAYIMNGRLYVWQPGAGWRYRDQIDWTLDGPYNSDYDFVYGTFTEEAFRTRPTWTLDGAGQGNFVVVPGTDTGEYGFRTYEAAEAENSQETYGLLDLTDPDPIQVPEDAPAELVAEVLASRAAGILALRGTPPFTIEGGVLSEAAPISVDHLRPGSLWKLDVFDDGFPELLTSARLSRVSVSVSRTATGISEDISPTLEPTGSVS